LIFISALGIIPIALGLNYKSIWYKLPVIESLRLPVLSAIISNETFEITYNKLLQLCDSEKKNMINKEVYEAIKTELQQINVTLIAVSKTKPIEDILELYNLGQRDFGENYVQELADKYEQLPKDICWHFIGHLQSNKVKYIAPFVHLIHGVDSESLLKEINKQATKNNRVIDVLLQVHIAQEETKFGFSEEELENVLLCRYENVQIKGLMGMASFSDDMNKVRSEFKGLKTLFDKTHSALSLPPFAFSIKPSAFSIKPSAFSILSMGMSGDYKTAVEEGSTMVRIGSLIFGEREKK
jgi:PLP dependent protein